MYRSISASLLLRTSGLLCRPQPKMASSACKQVVPALWMQLNTCFTGRTYALCVEEGGKWNLIFDSHTVCSLLQDYGAVQHSHNCGGRFIKPDASPPWQKLKYTRRHLISETSHLHYALHVLCRLHETVSCRHAKFALGG